MKTLSEFLVESKTYLRWGAAWETLETMKGHNSSEIHGGRAWKTNEGVSCVEDTPSGIGYLIRFIDSTLKTGDGVLYGNIYRLTGNQIGTCNDGQPLIRVESAEKVMQARAWRKQFEKQFPLMESKFNPGENVFDWLNAMEKTMKDFGCTSIKSHFANTGTIYYEFDHTVFESEDDENGTMRIRVASHAPNYGRKDWVLSIDPSEYTVQDFFEWLHEKTGKPIPHSAKVLEDYPYPPDGKD